MQRKITGIHRWEWKSPRKNPERTHKVTKYRADTTRSGRHSIQSWITAETTPDNGSPDTDLSKSFDHCLRPWRSEQVAGCVQGRDDDRDVLDVLGDSQTKESRDRMRCVAVEAIPV